MSFSIKAIIRGFVAPNHGLNCQRGLWQHVLSELERRSEGSHESGVFLLGVCDGAKRDVRDAVFYDDLDAGAYSSGVCVLHGEAFARLWAICRAKNLTVVADVHTHPAQAFQSSSDRVNPMVAREGHIAIIVPNYASMPVRECDFGIYKYLGDHEWRDCRSADKRGFIYTGFWT